MEKQRRRLVLACQRCRDANTDPHAMHVLLCCVQQWIMRQGEVARELLHCNSRFHVSELPEDKRKKESEGGRREESSEALRYFLVGTRPVPPASIQNTPAVVLEISVDTQKSTYDP